MDGNPGKAKKWVKVDRNVAKVEEALQDQVAKEQDNSPLAISEKELEMKIKEFKLEMAHNDADVRRLFFDELADLKYLEIQNQLSDSYIEHDLKTAEHQASKNLVNKILSEAETNEMAARLARHLMYIKEKVEMDTAGPKASAEVNKVAVDVFRAESEKERVAYTEGAKTAEAKALFAISSDAADAKKASAAIEKIKLNTQLQETALRQAPDDGYNLASSEGFKFVLKEFKFHYELRYVAAALLSLVLFALVRFIGMPALVLSVVFMAHVTSLSIVAAQVINPLLRYKSGSRYTYKARQTFETVPGKPLLAGMDVRMENDRRDLVKYDGLIRFFDVTHRFVAPVKFLTYEFPFLKIYREKKTVVAVSVGMLQQIITKRVSFCDEESWVRSKLEYNMSNMTNVNIDKELMFIPHPDTGKRHGFAVFQGTVDVAWGWFCSQKQMTYHVPRPRAVVSQPK